MSILKKKFGSADGLGKILHKLANFRVLILALSSIVLPRTKRFFQIVKEQGVPAAGVQAPGVPESGVKIQNFVKLAYASTIVLPRTGVPAAGVPVSGVPDSGSKFKISSN